MTAPRRGVVPLLLALAGLPGLTGCDRKPDEASPPVRPALTMVVQPAGRVAERRFTGTVQPRYEVKLGFQTTGRMTSRDLDVGDRVAVGQTLATLDPTVLRLAVASATADLANGQAALVNAQATDDRQQELIKGGSVSQAQVDSAVASRDTAASKVDQARASLQKAKEQLSYATLKSGYDGVVETWAAEVGQVVTASQSVVTIARPDARDAVFDLPDDRVASFAEGRTSSVVLLADPTVSARATVREIAPQSDPLTRTRRVRLTLDDASAAFRLGTTVTTALLEPETGRDRITLPAMAVLDRDGATSVWIVGSDDRLRSQSVTLDGPRGDVVAVAAGLAPGDRVLVAGVHSVAAGQAVKIAPP